MATFYLKLRNLRQAVDEMLEELDDSPEGVERVEGKELPGVDAGDGRGKPKPRGRGRGPRRA